MKPPLIYRLVNALRAWTERDDRMLVEQWKTAFAPEVRHVVVHRARCRRPTDAPVVGARPAAAGPASARHAVSALSIGAVAGRALSRLLVPRRRRELATRPRRVA